MKHLVKVSVILGGFLLLTLSLIPVRESQAQAGDWWGHYYDNSSLSGEAVVVRQDSFLKFDWGYGRPHPNLPEDQFSVRWVGSYHAKETGMYRVEVNADDGYRVYVDGNLLLDAWWRTPGSTSVTDVHLTKGGHSVKIEYHEQESAAYFGFKILEKPEGQPAGQMLQFVGEMTAGYNYNTGVNQVEALPFVGFEALLFGQETPSDLLHYYDDNPKEIEHGGYIYRDYRVGCMYVPEICEAGIEVVALEDAGDRTADPIARIELGYIYDFDIEGNTLTAVKTGTSRYVNYLFSQAIHIVDIGDADNPNLIRTYYPGSDDRSLFKQERTGITRMMGVNANDVFIYWSDGRLDVFDFSNPHIPQKIGGNWVPYVDTGYRGGSHQEPTAREISIIPHGDDTWVYVPTTRNQFAVYKLR